MKDTTALLPYVKLRFNIEHPNFEDCYMYGYECALAEIGEDDNPFPANTPECEQWLEGWWAGFYGEKPLYDWDNVTREEQVVTGEIASNDQEFSLTNRKFLANVIKITGALAASALVGYQIIDLVA
ncbi:hypothetical protein [Legionella spiritensis]|uniref:Transmission trait enhancer protein LetE n=1 Tax=Legionella spiritensis TaxID=452 RepID=A0A0W0Z6X4_LEGSP|nr:hypothetical protein [Legionella spiritensis]KTD64671.1 transmission trait enhancer protein LetE [Legionella spiritensis]SNV47807.1 transmission trait enhancer LetE [Legionella spiritensis]VEG91351.1 transmission trait enhancer LetE [Legionella spiritensis]